MPGWGARNGPRLRRMYPWLPERLFARMNMSRQHVTVAVALVGLVILAAAADGARTGGASRFYQIALIGFGLHGFFHIGQSAVTLGYTPGVITSPLIVIPFSAWAWRTIDEVGVASKDVGVTVVAAIMLFLAVLAAAHGTTWALLRVIHRR